MLDLSNYNILSEKVRLGVRISLAPKGFPYYTVCVVSDTYEAALKAALLTEESNLLDEQALANREEVLARLDLKSFFMVEEA
jgi:hypothetical protein